MSTSPVSVSADAIRLDLDAADAAEAIRAVAAPLVAAGHVTADYVAAAIAREATFPTGLPTAPEPVAVPHADPDGVLVPSIALGRFREPVEFTEMAADRRLRVRLVLLLALQSKDQAAVLSLLIRGLGDGDLLAFLLESTSAEAIATRLRGLIADG
ncbi:MAG TPA: PTS sugar transporter subunit IIA [Candidatus Limnocylindrales bacterium]|nr:PTS sugar transporter subunit IIA [Candidatus Limnocylindrales bacterium]